MNAINYEDLHKIYNGLYTSDEQQPEQQPVEEQQLTEREVDLDQEVPRREVVFDMPDPRMTYSRTVFDDPARDLIRTTAEYALGYKIADYLGVFNFGEEYGNDDWSRGQREMKRRRKEGTY